MAQSAKQRRRELARQRHERQQARRAEQAKRRRTGGLAVAAVLAVAALVTGTLYFSGVFGGGDDTVAASSDSDPEATQAPEPGSCEYRASGTSAVPDLGTPAVPVDAATLPGTATLTLNGSPVTVQLDAAAPCTVNSLAHLASAGYFDGTTCHRLTTSESLKVLQCGDPTGTGSGGPGYEFDNENTDGATYPAGTVAMANSGADTNGSQFFLVYADSELPPNYTVFGQITTGLDVITGIAADGTDNGLEDGAPLHPVTLDTVTTAA
ncbi:peptidylprolyl isomerase [Jiangella gansuensis]|uniref:peptidylprolyl isomerase n=1 Tax=Jiangella gansuensis TaxID=281473 RepID=UPI00047E8736|nr:peptidylprolyl isomerase [Jiangella gansuensis]